MPLLFIINVMKTLQKTGTVENGSELQQVHFYIFTVMYSISF